MLPNFAKATPAVESVSGVLNGGQSVTIIGSGFGIKTIVAPAYFFGNQNNTVGELPVNLTSSNTEAGGLVSIDNERVVGVPLIKWNYLCTAPTDEWCLANGHNAGCNCESWGRDVFDWGVGGTKEFYMTTWAYLDKTGSTCDQWQWKYMSTSASVAHEGYIAYPGDPGFGGMWFWNENGNNWFNTALQEYYSPYPTNNNYESASNHYQTSGSISADGWLWNQWQRMEFYEKASDNGTGMVYMNRIGRAGPPIESHINWWNMGAGDMLNPWKMTGIGMAVASVNNSVDSCNGSGKTVDFKLYNDNLYLDSTQARVEICDSTTWLARTHCEIQVPQNTWNDGQIEIKLNQGSFLNNAAVYLYVVDADGLVNSAGYSIILGTVPGDIIAPAVPTGLEVV
ncbi:MAG: hypothetical protein US25_C0046G0002 [Candidatus Moranbacteria bacterium GW2011_GWE1_36_7]|nr:MAG: hypothetical protein UR99_C0051G0002 [Candidatus Moranbacteria bacterium GW2011_GWD2_36_12]KKQ04789.1 MAG: hypothetical protein US16_C0047G0002 [Candidatus Moranbacteria bacterium GW2011_GWE2_36_40]KKQ12729.1 MAG: hypothetical protein US25_C0046G0002 [Candidatus Moranbacteria bacterium GW2011_GWE1_36_7]